MKIKANGKNDYKAYKKLLKTSSPLTMPFYWTLVVLYTLTVIVTYVDLEQGKLIVNIPAIIFWFLLDLVIILSVIGIPKRCYKSTKIADGIETEYVFEEDEFIARCEHKAYRTEAKVDYKILKNVYELNEYIFLFVSKRQAYIVEKDSISVDEVSVLRETLLKKIGKNYKLRLGK